MKLEEAIKPEQIDDLKKTYPTGGINFKNKSKFLGITHEAIGGFPEVAISIEMIESTNWGISFLSLDKEFCRMLFGDKPTPHIPTGRELLKKGIENSCRTKCDGWLAGFHRGLYEGSERERVLHEIIEGMIKVKTKKARDNWASRYAFFCRDVWKTKPGTEQCQENNQPTEENGR